MSGKQGRPPTLRTKIFQNLKQKIELGTWNVGDKFPSENQLCREYGVSRITIRSAIQQLEAIGLIQTSQGGRTIVIRTKAVGTDTALNPLLKNQSNVDTIQVLEYRMIVEKGAVGLAAQHITDDQLIELEEIFSSMLVNFDDIEKFSQADYLFHRKIAEASRNPILLQVTQSIEEVLSSTMTTIVSLLGCAIGIHYHRLLLAALRLRDKQRSESVMEEHLQATIDGVKDFLIDSSEQAQGE
jgi:GntR family transcriptional repressor for pyruvate dehydrogenase complex